MSIWSRDLSYPNHFNSLESYFFSFQHFFFFFGSSLFLHYYLSLLLVLEFYLANILSTFSLLLNLLGFILVILHAQQTIRVLLFQHNFIIIIFIFLTIDLSPLRKNMSGCEIVVLIQAATYSFSTCWLLHLGSFILLFLSISEQIILQFMYVNNFFHGPLLHLKNMIYKKSSPMHHQVV